MEDLLGLLLLVNLLVAVEDLLIFVLDKILYMLELLLLVVAEAEEKMLKPVDMEEVRLEVDLVVVRLDLRLVLPVILELVVTLLMMEVEAVADGMALIQVVDRLFQPLQLQGLTHQVLLVVLAMFIPLLPHQIIHQVAY